MFRGTKCNDRWEDTTNRLNTPIKFPVNGQQQEKTDYKFSIVDRSSFYDWYNAYLLVKFKVQKLADGTALNDKKISVISDATNLLDQITVRQNSKIVYNCTSLSTANHVKSLLTLSDNYVNSVGKK